MEWKKIKRTKMRASFLYMVIHTYSVQGTHTFIADMVHKKHMKQLSGNIAYSPCSLNGDGECCIVHYTDEYKNKLLSLPQILHTIRFHQKKANYSTHFVRRWQMDVGTYTQKKNNNLLIHRTIGNKWAQFWKQAKEKKRFVLIEEKCGILNFRWMWIVGGEVLQFFDKNPKSDILQPN